MRRIDARTVELTEAEAACREKFEEWLARGKSLPEAAVRALRRMDERPDEAFIDYLSDGTCRRWGQRILIRPEWRRRIEAEARGLPRPD